MDKNDGIPPITFSWQSKRWNIGIAWLVILGFDLVGPLLLYYLVTDHTDLEEDAVLGIALAALGIGEILEFPYRTYLLIRYRSEYGPLNSEGDGRWYHFDIVWWFYILATIVATVPFAVSSSVNKPPPRSFATLYKKRRKLTFGHRLFRYSIKSISCHLRFWSGLSED